MRQVTLTKPTKKWHTYARIIKAADVMPAVADISELHHLPGTMVDLHRRQTVDIEAGEFVVYGVQEKYGYSLCLYAVDEQNRLWTIQADADLKSAFKWWASRGIDRTRDAKLSKAGFPRRGAVLRVDLRGKGQYAAFARVIVATRGGMTLAQLVRSWAAAERLPGFKAALENIRRSRAAAAAHEERMAKLAALQAVAAEEAEFQAAMAVDGDAIAQLVL